jgi:polyisoprenoid-binding protein YceI
MRWIRRLVVLVALAIAAVVGVSLLRGADTPPPPRLPKAGSGVAAGPLRGTLAPTAGSFVGYRVRETVAGVGLNEAVGRTAQVDGTVRIERGRIVRARFETDTRTLRSDESRRDEALRGRGLQTDRYPLARFVLGPPVRIAARFTARGRLTLHGAARMVRIALRSRRVAGGVDLVGSTPIRFADYGMRPPSVAGVASVRDHGVMEVRLRLR